MPNVLQTHWAVELDDGSTVQFGQGVIFGEVPQDRVRRLTVATGMTPGDRLRTITHEVLIAPPMRPVYFQEHRVAIDPNTGVARRRSVVCVGWQSTVDGRNVQALTWITDDGRIVQTNGPWTGWAA